jgi:hypothetical protein
MRADYCVACGGIVSRYQFYYNIFVLQQFLSYNNFVLQQFLSTQLLCAAYLLTWLAPKMQHATPSWIKCGRALV